MKCSPYEKQWNKSLSNIGGAFHKGNIILFCNGKLISVAALFVSLNYSVISQRGNPIPYLMAALQISNENPIAAVNDNSSNSYIYITKNNADSQQALLEYIETKFDA